MAIDKVKPYSPEGDRKTQIRQMFDSIAGRYDLVNRLMSGGLDVLWRRSAVNRLRPLAHARILDLATGTGDFAVTIARREPTARVVGLDLSEQMLAEARKKAASLPPESRPEFRQGEAEKLPFPDSSFEAVTIGFGIRNFADAEGGLREVLRVLVPGGTCVILEPAEPGNRLARALFRFHFHVLVPFVGKLLSGDEKAYRYLPASVDAFATREDFNAMARRAGFAGAQYRILFPGGCILYELKKEKPAFTPAASLSGRKKPAGKKSRKKI